MSSATVLSQNDRAVLGALFDPEASLTNGTPTTAPSSSTTTTDTVPKHIKASEQSAIETLNTAHPSASAITSAIASLSAIISAHPTYASAYTNRAQATRLLPSALTAPSTVQAIFADLATAIRLSTPPSPLTPTSPYDARVLASAHTHRGYLLLRAASEPKFCALVSTLDPRASALQLPSSCGGLTPAVLEEVASREFAVAGRYGHKTAQTLAVRTNPYAKLCGQIVKEALQREIKEFYDVA